MNTSNQPFRIEFPDFDPVTMPVIPDHFVDTSWHNDSCPSFLNERLGLIIFVDFLHAADREHEDTKRFTVDIWDDGATGQIILHTDEWADVIALVEKRTAEMDCVG